VQRAAALAVVCSRIHVLESGAAAAQCSEALGVAAPDAALRAELSDFLASKSNRWIKIKMYFGHALLFHVRLLVQRLPRFPLFKRIFRSDSKF